MTNASRAFRSGLAAALAVSTVASSALVLRALDAGEALRVGDWSFAQLLGYERQALAVLEKGFTPVAVERSLRASQAGTELAPLSNLSRLRPHYLTWLMTGEITPEGVAAIRTSYDLVAYDYDAGEWRIELALANWAQIPADLRTKVRAEAVAFGRTKRAARIKAAIEVTPDTRLRQEARNWLKDAR
jgi:hypothetical protein